MRGITYVVDEKGRKIAAQIDLKRWGKRWQDFCDAVEAESRKNEPTLSLDEAVQKLKAEER